MTEHFWTGFEKRAEEGPEDHHLRRFLIGNPASAAIEARKGDKLKAFGEAYGHATTNTYAGSALGAGAGAGIGLLGGALHGGKGMKGRGAFLGALGGSVVGTLAGSLKGHLGEHASKIHGRYSKHRDAVPPVIPIEA